MAGAGWSVDETQTMFSVRSQANIQSKLDSMLEKLSNFEDMAREPEPLRLGHEIHQRKQANFREQGTYV